MLYADFGQTGLRVSKIGFGGMRFEKPEDTDAMAEVVLHAFDKGINYFDTAPDYCDYQSEVIFGRAIQALKKQDKPFYISSKTTAADPDTVRRHCEESLERLGVDAIDFYHVWCLVKPEDLPARKKKGVLRIFSQLKEEGLIKHISVSTHLEHGYVEPMLEQGEGLFESMLIGLNLQNSHLRLEGVQAAAARKMAVVTMNTLGGGILTDHKDRYKQVLRPGDKSILDAALRFNLSIPEVTVALVGFRNKEDIDTATEAVQRFTAMSADEIAEVSEIMAGTYKDMCTQCGYCRDCPAGIPVVRLMEAYNHGMLRGMDRARSHMRYHWNSPDVEALLADCTQCHLCEEVCTQHLPILDRFEELKQG
jgi:predicted aldo/keto reductase-like oxidoreductase